MDEIELKEKQISDKQWASIVEGYKKNCKDYERIIRMKDNEINDLKMLMVEVLKLLLHNIKIGKEDKSQ